MTKVVTMKEAIAQHVNDGAFLFIGGVAPGDGEVLLPLPDDLVDRGEGRPADVAADEEEGAIADMLRDGVLHRHNFCHLAPPVTQHEFGAASAGPV